jgi:hypothetical protein
MPLPFLAIALIGVGSMVIGYLLMPKPKPPKPTTVDDLQEPTAEAGRAIPVVFGSVQMKGLNVLYYGDKSITTRKPK